MKVIDLGARLKSAFGYAENSATAIGKKQKIAKDNGVKDAHTYSNNANFERTTIRRTSKEPDEISLVFGSMINNITGHKIFAPSPMSSFSKGKNLTSLKLTIQMPKW